MSTGIQSHSLHVFRIYSERPITIPMCTMRNDMKDMTQLPLAGKAHCFHTDPDRHCDKPNTWRIITCLLRFFSAVNFSPLKAR